MVYFISSRTFCRENRKNVYLQSATTATALPAGGVRRDWSTVFDTSDFHTSTSQSTNGSLTTWSWRLLFGTTTSADFNMQRGDSELFASDGDVLRGLHSGVWRVLVTIGFYFHTTRHADDSFFARQVGNMNEGVVVRSVQVAKAKYVLTVINLRSEANNLFLLGFTFL